MQSNRPPIIVILGHVDHGKTSLLDYLRKTNIASKEAGGITQSTRSFQLKPSSHLGISTPMTFIDTPGHAIFSSMRQRGSSIADMAILVVAADDGVKPQTKESIEFIQNSGIPFIVAINKTDLQTADPDRVKTQLTENSVVVEDFGGNVPAVNISAKTGAGIKDLLEMINLVSSLNPSQADPEGVLSLVVLESHMDSKKGPLATVVVKNGTLNTGQELFQSNSIGKVRALLDSEDQSIKSALPSSPVEIMGLSMVPAVGSVILDAPATADSNSFSQANGVVKSDIQKFNLIIKADVAGSLEAILTSLLPEIYVVSSSTGDINENDILLARTSRATVLGFNLRISNSVAKLVETEKVTVKTFTLIYELFEYLEELVHPKITYQIVGKAVVLADFKINSDRIAGCKCTEGVIDKTSKIRLFRGDLQISETHIKSLHQGKNIIDKVKAGVEFGAVFSPFIDFKVGDNIMATTG
jgi:translation initiation factor IF-2